MVLAAARRTWRLAQAVSRDRLSYPATRLAPSTQRSPVEALRDLGLDGRLGELERDFERVKAELFPVLLERAHAVDPRAGFVAKLEQYDHYALSSLSLVYLAVRALQPRAVFETGTFTGLLSTFVLRALADNGGGRLVSFDLPAHRPIHRSIGEVLPPGQAPGWIIPDDLRSRLELVLGDARKTLPEASRAEGSIGAFIHDSLHTTRHQSFEYRLAWRTLVPGGLLISDDAFMTPAFWWFTKTRRVPFLHVGNVGVTRKPATGETPGPGR